MAIALQALSVSGLASRLSGLAASGGSVTGGNRAAGCMSKSALAAALAPAFTAGAGSVTGGNRAGAALSVEALEAELLADGVFAAAGGGGGTAPEFSGTIADILAEANVTNTTVPTASFFTGATSYALDAAPNEAIPAGVTINSSTGVITVAPTAIGVARVVVIATNAGGSTMSNSFWLTVHS